MLVPLLDVLGWGRGGLQGVGSGVVGVGDGIVLIPGVWFLVPGAGMIALHT